MPSGMLSMNASLLKHMFREIENFYLHVNCQTKEIHVYNDPKRTIFLLFCYPNNCAPYIPLGM